MYIQILSTNLKESLECDNQSYFQQRKHVTMMYHLLLRYNFTSSTNIPQNLNSIRKLLNSIINKETLSLICVPDNTIGNEVIFHILSIILKFKY